MENKELKQSYIDERTGIEYIMTIIFQTLYYQNQEEQEMWGNMEE